MFDVLGASDPLNGISHLLNCVHQGPYIASNVVKNMNRGHLGIGQEAKSEGVAPPLKISGKELKIIKVRYLR